MTNPNNAVGTNAAYGGRTSVNAFNDLANFYSRGIVSGWMAAPSSGMTIQLGGLAGIRDVALAEDPNGNKTTVNNTTTSPISVEIAAASTTATRHDLIVAYVNSPAQVSSTTLDNPSACGIIAVQGSQSSLPNDAAIRAAITSDGGTGTTAYYVALAEVSVPANTTTITSGLILQTDFNAQVSPADILPPESITADKIDFATLNQGSEFVVGNFNGQTIYKKIISFTPTINSATVTVPHGINNFDSLISATGVVDLQTSGKSFYVINGINLGSSMGEFIWAVSASNITLLTSANFYSTVTKKPHTISLEYTKTV